MQCPYQELPIGIKDPDELTTEAMEYWNGAMGVEIFNEYSRGIRLVYLDVEEDRNGVTYFNCNEDGFKSHARIEIEDNLSDEKTISIISHELGHVIGMQHTKYGIMQSPVPYGDANDKISMMKDYFFELYPDYAN